MALALPASTNDVSPTSQQPDSVFDAVLGLTRLRSSSSPDEISPSQSPNGDGEAQEVPEARLQDTQNQAEKQILDVTLPLSRLEAVPSITSHHRAVRPMSAPCENLMSYPTTAFILTTEAERFAYADKIAAMERAAAAASVARPIYPYQQAPYLTYTRGVAAAPVVSLPILHQQQTVEPARVPNKTFPETLYGVISSEVHSDIVSWLPHGKGFIINDKQRFSNIILPEFFDRAKFTSFTRRLKRWNFVRTARGPETGAYYNTEFMKDRLDLVQKMRYKSGGGQFDEAQNKSDGKDDLEEEEKLVEHIEEDEVKKTKNDESIPGKRDAHAKVSPEMTSQAFQPVEIHSPEAKARSSTDHQARTMPILSPLPKQSMTAFDAADKTQVAIPAPSIEILGNNHNPTVGAKAPILTRGYPGLVASRELDEQRRRQIEHKVFLARPMGARMPHEILSNARSGTTSSDVAALYSRPIATSGVVSRHPYHTSSGTSMQRMFEVERARRILEAESAHYERILGPNSFRMTREDAVHAIAPREAPYARSNPPIIHSSAGPTQGCSTKGSIATVSEETSTQSSQMNNESLDKIYHDEALSKKDLCKGQVPIGDNGRKRQVVMSMQEQEEFAEYLFKKRQSMKVLQG